jgi:hypothetical protein
MVTKHSEDLYFKNGIPKITAEEVAALFGDFVPIEVVALLHKSDASLIEVRQAMYTAASKKIDSRDPDPSKEGIFRDHNCWKCRNGKDPCHYGNPNQCDYPHARND